MGSAWDLVLVRATSTLLAVTAGVGNGRYKNILDTQRFWINYGLQLLELLRLLSMSMSQFTGVPGQYNGLGLCKATKGSSVDRTLMFEISQELLQGVNCQEEILIIAVQR